MKQYISSVMLALLLSISSFSALRGTVCCSCSCDPCCGDENTTVGEALEDNILPFCKPEVLVAFRLVSKFYKNEIDEFHSCIVEEYKNKKEQKK